MATGAAQEKLNPDLLCWQIRDSASSEDLGTSAISTFLLTSGKGQIELFRYDKLFPQVRFAESDKFFASHASVFHFEIIVIFQIEMGDATEVAPPMEETS